QAAIAIANARLFQNLQESNRQVTEALEQQTATADVLRVIASAPADLQHVLDTIVASAARLCEASNASVWRVIDDELHHAAGLGAARARAGTVVPINRGSMTGRAASDRRTHHELDVRSILHQLDVSRARMPDRARTMVTTPLMRDGVAVGVISIYRQEVRAF